MVVGSVQGIPAAVVREIPGDEFLHDVKQRFPSGIGKADSQHTVIPQMVHESRDGLFMIRYPLEGGIGEHQVILSLELHHVQCQKLTLRMPLPGQAGHFRIPVDARDSGFMKDIVEGPGALPVSAAKVHSRADQDIHPLGQVLCRLTRLLCKLTVFIYIPVHNIHPFLPCLMLSVCCIRPVTVLSSPCTLPPSKVTGVNRHIL